MKADDILPEKYKDTVTMKFPMPGTEYQEFEEYHVRPYDFCFLFDAQNAEGAKLNSFAQYLDHAANCIYGMAIALNAENFFTKITSTEFIRINT
jgi:hypothetical protein